LIPALAALDGDIKTWLGLAAACAAAHRGLVPPPPSAPAATLGWWLAAAGAPAEVSASDLFTDVRRPANLTSALRAVASRGAAIAADPGRLGDAYAAANAPETRRAGGRFYTPRDLAALAMDGAVEPGTDVLDPACGGGRFLLCALDHLAPGAPSPARAHAVEDHLAGVDRDPMAVAICRAALWLAAAPGPGARLRVDRRVVVADALDALAAARLDGRAPPPPLAAGAFRSVVGNPPYRAGRFAPIAENDARFREAFAVAEYQLDPFPLFLELGLWALAPGGTLSMVVPNSWMSNLRMRRLRGLVLGENALDRVVELPPDAFGAGVETVVARVRRGGRTAREIPVWDVEGEPRGTLIVEPGDPAAPVALTRDAATRRLLIASARWTRTLGDVAEITRGINPYHHLTHTAEEIRDRVHHADHRRDETFAPELRGRDLGRYRLGWTGDHWIRYGPWLKEPRDPRFFDGSRILVRKILGETLCAVWLDGPFLADQSVYIARLRADQPWPPGALLAIVNSRLVAALLRARHQEHDTLFPQLKVGELRSLPLPPVDPADGAVTALGRRALDIQALETAQLEALDATVGPRPSASRASARSRLLRAGWPGSGGDAAARHRARQASALNETIEQIVEALFAIAPAG